MSLSTLSSRRGYAGLHESRGFRTGHYSGLSERVPLFAKAKMHLAGCGLTQAGEKGWGAAAVAVKAVAEARGMRHEGHREL